MPRLNTFDKWFGEYCAESMVFNLPYNERNQDYYYDYYEAGMTPREAVLEEIREYYYDDEEYDWN
jgi:hypothetical protein